ncbi:5,6-dimethylbenzimidazole synthase [Shewanella gelidimarina]|uniref:5,6-dimethylbenzimidazole synthase n=1 Tax=Shewanella gelidimarina TaxID=56813 RepID=UPI0020101304|nr:5,6-dimethylbenzimidazole synthase [Shewanella gelidimarina]MCL1057472.1 5,6-dimethylbenzimidazole synthase [Shewanella gelidimarina]
MSRIFSDNESQTLADIIRLRRDVRGNRFNDKPVSDTTIDTLLNAAMLAPSVGYSQPWQFVVIRDSNIKQAVQQTFVTANALGSQQFTGDKRAQYDALKLEGILEAPVNLAVFYQPSETAVLGQTSMPEMGKFSVVCAIQNLWLMARSLNIGVGWVSILDPLKVKQALNAPESAELIGYLCIGYVDEFLAEPELKQKGWQKTKSPAEVIFKDGFN